MSEWPAGQSPFTGADPIVVPPPTPHSERVACMMLRLARDELSFGAIEKHLRVMERFADTGDSDFLDAAGPMGEWARQTAHRILGDLRTSVVCSENGSGNLAPSTPTAGGQ